MVGSDFGGNSKSCWPIRITLHRTERNKIDIDTIVHKQNDCIFTSIVVQIDWAHLFSNIHRNHPAHMYHHGEYLIPDDCMTSVEIQSISDLRIIRKNVQVYITKKKFKQTNLMEFCPMNRTLKLIREKKSCKLELSWMFTFMLPKWLNFLMHKNAVFDCCFSCRKKNVFYLHHYRHHSNSESMLRKPFINRLRAIYATTKLIGCNV